MADKIKLITINNPFNLNNRKIQDIEYTPETKLINLVKHNDEWKFDGDFIVCVNGKVISNDKLETTALVPGSYVSISPAIKKGGDGKNVLGVIAGIALSVVSMGVGNLIQYGVWSSAAGMAGWGFGAYLAATAVMYLGGTLISNMTTPKVDLPSLDTTQNYSWGSPQPLQGQGFAIGRIYGEVVPTPIKLSEHVFTDGEKQYLHLLLLLGGGPVDEVTNIKINDNPIENYSPVPDYDIRRGENNQEPIKNFDKTYADQSFNYELIPGSDWTIQETDGNSAQELEVELGFPNGLCYVNDSGGLSETNVTCAIEYRKKGASNWKPIYSGQVVENIQGIISNAKIKDGYCEPDTVWTLTYTGSTQGSYDRYLNRYNYTYIYTLTGVAGSEWFRQININVLMAGKYNLGNITLTGNLHFSNDYVEFDINITQTNYQSGSFSVRSQNTLIISGATNTLLRKQYKISNIGQDLQNPTQYEVRVKCISKAGTSLRHTNKVYWMTLSSVMNERFRRPGKVLLGIRALANNQLSNGITSVSCIVKRHTVLVWNPYTQIYERQQATNPAWAAYDYIHYAIEWEDRRTGQMVIVVYGDKKENLIYDEFKEWADFCVSKNLKFDYNFDKETQLWDGLKIIGNVGRGAAIKRGTKWGVICDKPSQPVQLFTMANIIEGSFQISYLSQKDRANQLEITFRDKQKGYERNTIPIFSDDYNTSTRVKNPTQITLDGVTDIQQVYREGKYRLKQNETLYQTTSFRAFIDSINCQAGDVILIQNDLPQWGYGGNIKAVSGTGGRTITLDREIEMLANTQYAILIRLKNDVLIQKNVLQVVQNTITNTVVVDSDFDSLPEEYDIYAFGPLNLVAKPFRIAHMGRDEDMTCTISSLEYVESVNDENYDIPVINYSLLNLYNEVMNISMAHETFSRPDGSTGAILHVSWKTNNSLKFKVFYRCYSDDDIPGNLIEYATTNNSYIDITNVQPGKKYGVKICSYNSLGQISPGVETAQIYISPKDIAPKAVTNFQAVLSPLDETIVDLSWTKNTEPDLKGYNISVDGVLKVKNWPDTKYSFQASASKTYTFSIAAVDNSDNVSDAVTFDIAVDVVPVTPEIVSAIIKNSNTIDTLWRISTLRALDGYELHIKQGSADYTPDATTKLAYIKGTNHNIAQMPNGTILTPAADYRIKICAVSKISQSLKSDYASIVCTTKDTITPVINITQTTPEIPASGIINAGANCNFYVKCSVSDNIAVSQVKGRIYEQGQSSGVAYEDFSAINSTNYDHTFSYAFAPAKTYVLECIAIDNSGNSGYVSKIFEADNVQAAWHSGDVITITQSNDIIEVSITDDAQPLHMKEYYVEYNISEDNNTWSGWKNLGEYTRKVFSMTLPVTGYFKVRAKIQKIHDANLDSEWKESNVLYVDRIAPVVKVTTTPDITKEMLLPANTVTFNLTFYDEGGLKSAQAFLDGISTNLTLNTSDNKNYTSQIAFNDLSNGIHNVFFKAVDNAGNEKESQVYYLEVDTNNSYANPANYTVTINRRTVNITINEYTLPNNFKEFEFYMKNGTTETSLGKSSTNTITVELSQDYSSVKFGALAAKKNGVRNTTINYTTANYFVDSVPPVINSFAVSGLTNGSYFNAATKTTAAIAYDVTDATSGISTKKAVLNGVEFDLTASPMNIAAKLTTDGNYSLKIKITDNAGNETISQPIDFIVDTMAPANVTNFTAKFQRKISLSWTNPAEIIDRVVITLNDGMKIFEGLATSYIYTPASGSDIVFKIKTYDKAGNASAESSITATNIGPKAVSNITSMAEISGGVFKWDNVTQNASSENTDDVIGYVYQWKTDSGTYGAEYETSGNSIPIFLTLAEKVAKKQNITLHVKSKNIWGKMSDYSTEITQTVINVQPVDMGNNPMDFTVIINDTDGSRNNLTNSGVADLINDDFNNA